VDGNILGIFQPLVGGCPDPDCPLPENGFKFGTFQPPSSAAAAKVNDNDPAIVQTDNHREDPMVSPSTFVAR